MAVIKNAPFHGTITLDPELEERRPAQPLYGRTIRNPRQPLDKPDALDIQQRELLGESLIEYRTLVVTRASGNELTRKQLERLNTVQATLGISLEAFKLDCEAAKGIAQAVSSLPDAATWAVQSQELAARQEKLALEIRATKDILRELESQSRSIDSERSIRIATQQEVNSRRAAAWRLTADVDETITKLTRIKSQSQPRGDERRVNYYHE